MSPVGSILSPSESLEQLADAIRRRTGHARQLLTVLRDRLVGETTGDCARIMRHLSEDFVIRRHDASGTVRISTRADVEAEILHFFATSHRAWVDWDYLVAEGSRVVGVGRLYRGDPEQPDNLSRSGVVLVFQFEGLKMSAEDIYTIV